MATDEPPSSGDSKKSTGRPLDVTGEEVRKNLRRIRDATGVSAPKLSELLTGLDRPMPPLGINRIESGQRRVDVDDLVALAVALQVSPLALLMPPSLSGDDVVSMTATGALSAGDLFAWLSGEAPLPGQRQSADMHWTLPEWFIEQQKALITYEIESASRSQLTRDQLQNDNIALQGQVDRLTRTAERQSETIESLVGMLKELGVGIELGPRPKEPARGDD